MTARIYDPAERRSIRTVYGKIRFRSKLEADWARAFDVMGVEWEYEHEGRYFGDVFYLPDFYLPQSRQYVEVKVTFSDHDCDKARALLADPPLRYYANSSCDIPLICCRPDGVFDGWLRQSNTLCASAEFLADAVPLSAYQCVHCRGWWFGVWSPWRDELVCECCGLPGPGFEFVLNQVESADYAGTSDKIHFSPLIGFPDLRNLRDACRG